MKIQGQDSECLNALNLTKYHQRGIFYPILNIHCDDPKVLLNYRGISVMRTVNKLYFTLLNKKLSSGERGLLVVFVSRNDIVIISLYCTGTIMQ